MKIRPWRQTRRHDLDLMLNIKHSLAVVGLPNIDVSRVEIRITDRPTIAEVEPIISRLESLDNWCRRQCSPILKWTYSPNEHVAVMRCLANERILLEELQADREAITAKERAS